MELFYIKILRAGSYNTPGTAESVLMPGHKDRSQAAIHKAVIAA